MPAGRVKIQVERASRIFMNAGVVAFEDLTLDLYENEIACVVGPSGCGKTTLLRCLDGLLPLSEGRILLDGRSVQRPPDKVAMVFQHFGLLPWRSVYANAAYGLKLAGAPADVIDTRVSAALKLVGLDAFARHYPYQLSGGMQQRVGLARALATDPEVLLMDEPFAALDAQTREILQEEMLRILERTRKTIVFVTHSIDEALLLGDRVIVLTARPARVKRIITVPYPRPRNLPAIRAEAGFGTLRAEVWELLREEIRGSAEEDGHG